MYKKRDEFIEIIKNIYNDQNLNISDNFKEYLIKACTEIQSGYKISFVSHWLYSQVINEMSGDENLYESEKMKYLKKYLESRKWKYIFGSFMVSGMPISPGQKSLGRFFGKK